MYPVFKNSLGMLADGCIITHEKSYSETGIDNLENYGKKNFKNRHVGHCADSGIIVRLLFSNGHA